MKTETPTPRTDAATYPADCLGKTLVTNRDCPRDLELEVTALIAEREQLRAELAEIHKSFAGNVHTENRELRAEVERLRSDRDCEKRLRKDADELREDSIARAKRAEAALAIEREKAERYRLVTLRQDAELRGALALGQENCDAVYDELRADCDELRADVVRLTARAERAEAELAAERALNCAFEEEAPDIIQNLHTRAAKALKALCSPNNCGLPPKGRNAP
jgi:hypothetical protein